MTLPSIWANLMTSACWAVTARMTISCWPLRDVPGRRGAGAAAGRGRRGVAAAVSAGGGGSSVPRTWMPWRSSLTLVPLRPATTVIELSSGVDGDDRELVGGQADDHVDVVTGLDDRADAADLVDLDGHAAQGRPGSRCCRSTPGDCRRRGSSTVIWAPFATCWRAIWPTTWETSVKAPGSLALEVDRLGRDLVRADPGRQRDVDRGDDDRAGRRCDGLLRQSRLPRRARGCRRRRRSPGTPRRAGRADSSASSWFSPR